MFTDFFFPDRCINCNEIIAPKTFVCALCKNQLKFSTEEFDAENVLKEQCKTLFPVENAFALMAFDKEGLSRKLMHNLKYKNRPNVGEIFAEWTTERLVFKEKPDQIIAVPLHSKKENERGYNQLHIYAKLISDYFQIAFDPTIMQRNFYQKAQALKNKSGRGNRDHLFSLTENIAGKHVLIVDDVFTTGNTMSAMAWELLKNNNNKVSVLVLAHDL